MITGVDILPVIEIYSGKGGATFAATNRAWWQQVLVSSSGLLAPTIVSWLLTTGLKTSTSQRFSLGGLAAFMFSGQLLWVRGEIYLWILPTIAAAIMLIACLEWRVRRFALISLAIFIGTGALSDIAYMVFGFATNGELTTSSDTAKIAYALHGEARYSWLYGSVISGLTIAILLKAYRNIINNYTF